MDSKEYFNNLLILSGRINLIFLVLPILVYFWYKRNQQEFNYIILCFLIADFALNIFEQMIILGAKNFPSFKEFIHSIGIYNTNFLSIFGYLISYYFIGIFYKKVINNEIGTWILNISRVLCLVSIIIFFFVDGYSNPGAVNQTIFKIYSIAIPIIGIREILRQNVIKNVLNDSYFLISLAIIVSPIITMVMNFYSDNIYSTDFNLFVKLSLLRNFLSLMSIFLYCRAFYKPS